MMKIALRIVVGLVRSGDNTLRDRYKDGDV
jgi:hypothetical protein